VALALSGGSAGGPGRRKAGPRPGEVVLDQQLLGQQVTHTAGTHHDRDPLRPGRRRPAAAVPAAQAHGLSNRGPGIE
jgi:hypothetical protein